MRNIVYYVASSLDGFIAKEDGSFDVFPYDPNYGNELISQFPETFPAPYRQQLGNTADNKLFDTVLMGRATYEVGVQHGLTSPYPTLDQYVISTTMAKSPDPAVTLISDNIIEQIRGIQQKPGKAIWLCGGGSLAATLLSAGLISKLIIKLNPITLGTGIPLFGGANHLAKLHLTDQQVFSSSHVLLYYTITCTKD